MTTREAIRLLLNPMKQRTQCYAEALALNMAIAALEKENEPAPSEDNTGYENQKNYFRNNNDSTEKAKCQEAEAIDLPEELIEDLFKLVNDCEQNIVTSCIKHKVYDIRKIHQIVCATMETALVMVRLGNEENK